MMRVEPLAPTMTFEQFCERHGIKVVVRERSLRNFKPNMRWYAAGDVEIVHDGLLTSPLGNGATPEEAVDAYSRTLLGHRLAKDAMRDTRVEFLAPNEWSL